MLESTQLLAKLTQRMSTDSRQLQGAPALEIKTSTFSVPVLVLASNDLAAISQQLQQTVEKAPDFFTHSPVVLDVLALNNNRLPIDLKNLCDIIRNAGMLPIGLRGGNEAQNAIALKLAIPNYSMHHPVGVEPAKTKAVEAKPAAGTVASVKLHTLPVRSGQRIYSEGDLIVMAPISAGAEVIAEGNIHIYSTLRGRALAGVPDNAEARIFCSDLQAELVSIAGNYQVSSNFTAPKGKPVQIYLHEQSLIIKDI